MTGAIDQNEPTQLFEHRAPTTAGTTVWMTVGSAAGSLVVGVASPALAARWFGQIPGSFGLFQSLSFTAKSLDGVGWWGLPFYELGLVLVVLPLSVGGLMIHAFRRRWRLVWSGLTSWCLQIGFFGVLILSLSALANMRSGEGVPSLGWFGGTGPGNLLIALVVVDGWYYLEHRARHRIELLERFHALHHDRAHVGPATGVRFNIIEAFWTVITLVPLVVLGFDFLAVVAARLVIQLYQSVMHNELVPAVPGLDRLLVTPAVHRAHHRSAASSEPVNYGGILSLWDVMFGTYGTADRRTSPNHATGETAGAT